MTAFAATCACWLLPLPAVRAFAVALMVAVQQGNDFYMLSQIRPPYFLRDVRTAARRREARARMPFFISAVVVSLILRDLRALVAYVVIWGVSNELATQAEKDDGVYSGSIPSRLFVAVFRMFGDDEHSGRQRASFWRPVAIGSALVLCLTYLLPNGVNDARALSACIPIGVPAFIERVSGDHGKPATAAAVTTTIPLPQPSQIDDGADSTSTVSTTTSTADVPTSASTTSTSERTTTTTVPRESTSSAPSSTSVSTTTVSTTTASTTTTSTSVPTETTTSAPPTTTPDDGAP